MARPKSAMEADEEHPVGWNPTTGTLNIADEDVDEEQAEADAEGPESEE